MQQDNPEIQTSITQIFEVADKLEHPFGVALILKVSSELVEEAGHRIAAHSPGNRVASMMLLAARIEDLAEEISKS